MKTVNGNRDTSGGIEGLPLQLMIIILVATMGTAIIVGWMGSIETPHAIGSLIVDDCMEADNGSLDDFEITVLDQDGNCLEGATVVLDGLNVRMDGGTAYAMTNADGVASFENITVTAAEGSSVGFISVLVTKPGYTESSGYKITVIL